MTRSPLWREFESGDSLPVRILRVAVLGTAIAVLCFTAVLGLSWPQQLILALLSVVFAIWVDRGSSSYLVTLTLMLLSLYSTFRYAFWRISMTVNFFRDPGTAWSALDAFFIWTLLLAECYAFVVLGLGYLQMLWPLRRVPAPLPDDTDLWPAVDLVIPTYNEPLSVVRFTALAAMNIDWPADRLNVYILDDGKRDEFRAFAEEAGIGYMTRDDNRHAKAGNINSALARLDSPYLAVFDSDHVPTRSFLQVTMGWFLRDLKLGMLQTPHHFYSPDPFERNLGQFRTIPNEGELFYGIVQDGNDFWNATFFCGSCAVLRRSALDEVGGIAVETVTEDAHTSLRLQMAGWNTAYLNIPQAAGLATERLSGHVKQRIRWARGMVQILRIENPLLAPGLKPAQRLCYFNAMSHFLYALPRLIFLTAPLIYLVFGYTNIPGYWAAILAYAVPHLVLSNVTNSRVQGQHRHSFWNEIYETVLAPYIFLPTLFALISPKLGRFNVTAKGGVVSKEFFDARIARPFLVLLAINLFGVLCALPRFFQFPSFDVPGWLGTVVNWPASLFDPTHPGTVWMNLVWTLFNVVILGVATAVAWESQQRRQTVRMAIAVPSDVVLADGSMIRGMTADLSSGGVRTRMEYPLKADIGDPIRFIFPVLDGTATLPATVIEIDGPVLRAQFDPMTLQEEEALTMILYSRADTWLGWGEAREADRPLRSMRRILQLSVRGLTHTVRGLWRGRGSRPAAAKPRLATNAVPLLLFALLTGNTDRAHATPAASAPAAPRRAPSTAAASYDSVVPLASSGVHDTIVLRGTDAHHSIYFSTPRNQVIRSASLKLNYHFSPGLTPQVSQLNVILNGSLVATLPVTAPASYVGPTTASGTSDRNGAEKQLAAARPGERGVLLQTIVALPPDLLVRANQLTFEFIGHYTTRCEDPTNSTLWVHIDPNSTIELAGSLLPLPNDLNLLPLPFFDPASVTPATIPLVFAAQPSEKALRAAGILASWLGILTDYRTVRFPVSIGTLPQGNAILLAESAAQVPHAISVSGVSGPTVALRTNPADPNGKLLVVTGDNADDLVAAAMALALQRDLFAGSEVHIPDLGMPDARKPDDAPRWLSTDRNHPSNFGDSTQSGELQADGAIPVTTYLRLPPDLYFGQSRNLALHLSYRYNGIPLAQDSSLDVYANSAYVSSTPMPHTDHATSVLDTVVPVPIGTLRPFSNSLAMKFVFQPAKKGQCEDMAPTSLEGAILKDSYLDIANVPHWTVLPNLELFANAGFPFTRKADLADTAVVLPDQPTTDELELFLTLMGHFGAQTGYPVLSVTVVHPAEMNRNGEKDYLILGTAHDQPALKTLDGALPVEVDESGLHVRDTQGFFDRSANAWWRVGGSDHVRSGQLETSGGLPEALIEGLEWPRGSNRSVVAVVLRDPTSIPGFLSAFLQTSQSSDIADSVSVLHAGHFSSYRLGDDNYRVGELSWLTRLILFLSEFPILIAVVVLLACVLLAALLRAALRRQARERLHA